MRKRSFVLALVTGLVTLLARQGAATCDPTGADAADFTNARAAVAANCPCSPTSPHGAYVSCAADQAKATLVNKNCVGAVTRCAARSTCGKPGFVTCCRTRSNGLTKCLIKRDAARCRPPNNGQACVGNYSSCCDACTSSGCTPTTTSSVTTTSTTTSTVTSTTSTTSTSTTLAPCDGGSGPPVCDGTCPPNETCLLDDGTGSCVCVPQCASAGFPTCNGTCATGQVCQSAQQFDPGTNTFLTGCLCVGENSVCPSGNGPICQAPAGRCPPGQACSYSPIAPHVEGPICGCSAPIG